MKFHYGTVEVLVGVDMAKENHHSKPSPRPVTMCSLRVPNLPPGSHTFRRLNRCPVSTDVEATRDASSTLRYSNGITTVECNQALSFANRNTYRSGRS